jgi:8-oxo-dGTP diphosphatase
MIKVVCGIIREDDKIFIAKRKANIHLGGYWEFPGGKIKDSESPEDALKRELIEELGMEVIVKKFVTKQLHHYSDFSIELLAYDCEFIRATFSLIDHDQIEWIKLTDLKDFRMAPADISIVNWILMLD